MQIISVLATSQQFVALEDAVMLDITLCSESQ